jgi:hypothetical protein
MNDRIVIIGLVLLVVIGLLLLYAGNNLPSTATTDTTPPATQPAPTTPAP